jgi:hypothetical protein
MNYTALWQTKLLETIDDLQRRITDDFPGSGLGKLSGELRGVIAAALARVETIRRPNLGLRAGVWVLIAGLVALVGLIAVEVRWSPNTFRELPSLVQFVDSSLTSIVFLSAGVVSLVTLENRLKRGRALKALHELRAMAHIIDLHQLHKDPTLPGGASPSDRPALTEPQTARYLDYCSDLLALISKTAALYVQHFADPVALESVDQVEALTAGLSQKIWQKIMLLDRSGHPQI